MPKNSTRKKKKKKKKTTTTKTKKSTKMLLFLFQTLTSVALLLPCVTGMPFATTLAARIVVLVAQDSLATGKLAKVSEMGTVINELIVTNESDNIHFHSQTLEKVVLNLDLICIDKLNGNCQWRTQFGYLRM